MRTIVVSAVNLRKGGTLAILRECLAALSQLAQQGDYRIVALVHKKELAFYEGVEYIELPWSVRSWAHRLWCEYMTMYGISKMLGDIDLWLSLHDTTPRVKARRQAVYCHNSYPFFRWQWRHLWLNYRIVCFALFTKWIYRTNIHRNDFIIVQSEWFREAIAKMFGLSTDRIIVFPPNENDNLNENVTLRYENEDENVTLRYENEDENVTLRYENANLNPNHNVNEDEDENETLRYENANLNPNPNVNENENENANLNHDEGLTFNSQLSTFNSKFTFIYPAWPDVHKNFECICEAAGLLEQEVGTDKFEVILTTDRNANRYCRWINRRWGHVKSLHFTGFLDREKLYEQYAVSGCLVFPSQVETWGLPISEFASMGRPMLLADLPYAHETAMGSQLTAFFNPNNPKDLKEKMKQVMTGNFSGLHPVTPHTIQPPVVHTWHEIIELRPTF